MNKTKDMNRSLRSYNAPKLSNYGSVSSLTLTGKGKGKGKYKKPGNGVS